MILISGCLSGSNAFYSGAIKTCEPINKLVKEGRALPVCPELLGGLSVPRERSEIQNGSGKDVLAGKCRIITKSKEDVTGNFIAGARAALSLAKKYNIRKAVLKSRSPSCGCGEIYDGSFTGRFTNGDGVTCALLKSNGIEVISDEYFLAH